MIRSRPLDRRGLALGATLAACALASTEASAQNMYFSSMSNLSSSASASAGSVNFTYANAGPTSYISQYDSNTWGPGPAYATARFRLFAYGYLSGTQQQDWIVLLLSNDTASNFSSTGSFTMSFATDVDWFDNYVAEAWSNWTVDGNALADGQRISAGTHSFTWSLNNVIGTSVGGGSTAGVGGYFVQAPASGVPLPGAAGLAAVALAGSVRRRRR